MHNLLNHLVSNPNPTEDQLQRFLNHKRFTDIFTQLFLLCLLHFVWNDCHVFGVSEMECNLTNNAIMKKRLFCLLIQLMNPKEYSWARI